MRFGSSVHLCLVPLCLLLGGALVGCSKDKEKEPSASPATSAPVSVTSAASGTWVAASAVPQGNMTLGERFETEAKNRPTGAVRGEDVNAAFRKMGVEIVDEKQHLGKPFEASYCLGAKTKADDVSWSVCEYKDEASAKAGKALNDKSFPAQHRNTYVNGKTTLTILEVSVNAANDERVKKMASAFEALKPHPSP